MEKKYQGMTENGPSTTINVRTRVFSVCAAVIASATVFLQTGCVKDTLYNTPHPDKGAVVVRMDWSDLLPEAIADSYVLNVDGHEQTVSGDVNTVERLVEPGEHTLLIYNRPADITLNGDMASVDAETASATAEAPVKSLPDYLFSRCETIRVGKDDTLVVFSTPRQWVRQVNVDLSVTEGDYDRIASVTGTLSGVERSVDIRKEERTGTAAQTRNAFTVAGDKCRTSFRLLGIVPAQRQILTVYVTFTNGDRQTIGSDLTERLAGFHEGNTPLTLTADLHLPVQGGVAGSIEGWQQADGGNTDAH